MEDHVGSEEIVLRDQLDRLMRVVTSIKDVASAAASLDPLHAGLPLASSCVLMQVWLLFCSARLVCDMLT